MEETSNWSDQALNKLYHFDQLRKQREKGAVFYDFIEGPISMW